MLHPVAGTHPGGVPGGQGEGGGHQRNAVQGHRTAGPVGGVDPGGQPVHVRIVPVGHHHLDRAGLESVRNARVVAGTARP